MTNADYGFDNRLLKTAPRTWTPTQMRAMAKIQVVDGQAQNTLPQLRKLAANPAFPRQYVDQLVNIVNATGTATQEALAARIADPAQIGGTPTNIPSFIEWWNNGIPS